MVEPKVLPERVAKNSSRSGRGRPRRRRLPTAPSSREEELRVAVQKAFNNLVRERRHTRGEEHGDPVAISNDLQVIGLLMTEVHSEPYSCETCSWQRCTPSRATATPDHDRCAFRAALLQNLIMAEVHSEACYCEHLIMTEVRAEPRYCET